MSSILGWFSIEIAVPKCGLRKCGRQNDRLDGIGCGVPGDIRRNGAVTRGDLNISSCTGRAGRDGGAGTGGGFAVRGGGRE